MGENKTTSEVFKVYTSMNTEYDENNKIVRRDNMLTYSTFEKAMQHLEVVEILYKGKLTRDGIYSYVTYEDNGKQYMETIREILVF